MPATREWGRHRGEEWPQINGAAESGLERHETIVQLLLGKGANIELKTISGEAALLWAAKGGHEAVLQLLLEKGADVKVKDKYGVTALLWAAQNGHEAVVQLLTLLNLHLGFSKERDSTISFNSHGNN